MVLSLRTICAKPPHHTENILAQQTVMVNMH